MACALGRCGESRESSDKGVESADAHNADARVLARPGRLVRDLLARTDGIRKAAGVAGVQRRG